MERIALLAALLAGATAFGLWWRARDGRIRPATVSPASSVSPATGASPASAVSPATGASPASAVSPATGASPASAVSPATGPAGGTDGPGDLGGPAAFAGLGFDPADARVTLLQFSTAFCQPCRATRVILGEVAARFPGVRHVEVDAEAHLDMVRALDVRRTPTVLFVDAAGRVARRASGQPRRAEVIAAVAPYLDAWPDGTGASE
jgi:thiol-disulfide isomerase/thioredoxin